MGTPRLIDAHAHLNFAAFDDDRDEVIQRALANSVWMINVGTQANTSRTAVELAQKYKEGVYAIIGLHPVHTAKSYHDEVELGEGGATFTSRGEVFDMVVYEELARQPKVVGLGECGLDYFRIKNEEEKAKQKEIFKKQIELAIKVDKPLMLHIRDAYQDALSILNSYFLIHNSRLRGDVHFFAGTIAEAKSFLDLGFYLSFTGVITFAKDYEELVKFVPLDRILIETDCPYVAPVPYRGQRNEPVYVVEVAKVVARIKGLEVSEVEDQTVQNTRDLFGF
ncbi:MAG: TatD family hydrolase [Patescibacteria group bacterium]